MSDRTEIGTRTLKEEKSNTQNFRILDILEVSILVLARATLVLSVLLHLLSETLPLDMGTLGALVCSVKLPQKLVGGCE